jgi:hypothetical protein
MPELAFEFEFSAQLGRADFGVGPFDQRVLSEVAAVVSSEVNGSTAPWKYRVATGS